MAEANGRIKELIIKYLKEELIPNEHQELQDWASLSDENLALFSELTDPGRLREEMENLYRSKSNVWEKIDARMREAGEVESIERPVFTARHSYRRIRLYAAAASLILLLSAGAYLWLGRSAKVEVAGSKGATPRFKNDVAPGADRAILTLGDGSTIVLDSAGNGMLAQQGSTRISKNNGRLAYNASKNEKPSEITYNILTTPRAGQFMVVLPDQTKVWLNNQSSLKYPTAFSGQDRTVELSGEAYFEVAKNPAMPFTVKLPDAMRIEVLGTHFNVMAYGDEPDKKTTLLAGSVKVIKGSIHTILRPGEQAQVNRGGELKTVKDPDANGAIAWKNGYFHFDRADIQTMMRQLARWYDIDVVYDGKIQNALFDGDIQRNLPLSEVLDLLEKNQVHFTINNKVITVKP